MASGETAMKYLKQQGMNAKSNSLCKRSPNLIIRLCANIMQFCWPGRRPCVHSIKSFLGRFLPRHACNAIVLRFFISLPASFTVVNGNFFCAFFLLWNGFGFANETHKWTTSFQPQQKSRRISSLESSAFSRYRPTYKRVCALHIRTIWHGAVAEARGNWIK